MVTKDTALLITDMQNDFINGKGMLVVEGIKRNLSKFKEFVDDLRKKRILVIYTRHVFDKKTNPIEAKLFPKMIKYSSLKKQSEGYNICEELKAQKEDIIIDKTRYDAFIKTKLERILKNKKIKTLIITGTMTNICCESTARTAMMKDFEVLFCSDLTFTHDKNTHKNTLKNISTHFGKVMSSKDIIKYLKK